MDDAELRRLVPHVLSVLVRRGADFATAEYAVQVLAARLYTSAAQEAPNLLERAHQMRQAARVNQALGNGH